MENKNELPTEDAIEVLEAYYITERLFVKENLFEKSKTESNVLLGILRNLHSRTPSQEELSRYMQDCIQKALQSSEYNNEISN